ncbi:MAG: DUF2797 domain-containing protein [Halodesulfurarchaeum sp.]
MQIVGYETRAGERTPALVLAADGTVDRVALTAGTNLDLGLGDRHCAGAVEGDSHEACDAPAAPYCERHVDTWPCARCTGDCAMPLETCHEEHVVYLAAFAPDTFKVGVTRTWRLQTRLEEQGADLAAHIRTVENGRKARAIESALAADIGDRVRTPQKLPSLVRSVDRDAWNTLLDDHEPIETFAFEYGLALDRQPVQETLARGEVRGTKGRILVLDRRGTTYAVDMRDLVGHEVTEADRGGDRQSSLGAYE